MCVCVQEGDSAGTKFEGAVINSLIFVVFVGVMTFGLVLLFKYGVRLRAQLLRIAQGKHAETVLTQYTNIIWGYMGFAGFSIFFMLTGILAAQLIQLYQIPIDMFAFLFILYNFAASPPHAAAAGCVTSQLK